MNSVDISAVTEIIAADPAAMAQLAALRTLGLPDAWIGAGFVRNRVWDRLSGIWPPRSITDVDVIYFDAADAGGAHEAGYEAALLQVLPDVAWQVRNQARMHMRHGDAPYRDTASAMVRWLETPTAVGVRLATTDRLEVLAPHGLTDLLSLVCRPTDAGRERPHAYRARVIGKQWQSRWPRLLVIDAYDGGRMLP